MMTIERSLERTTEQPRSWRGPFRMPAVVCGWLVALLLLTASSWAQPSGNDSARHLAKSLARREFAGDPLAPFFQSGMFPDYRSYGWPFPAVKCHAYEINHSGVASIEVLLLLADLAIAIAILLASMNVVERLTGAKPRASPGP